MRRLPWRWGLLLVTASVAVSVVLSSLGVLLSYWELAQQPFGVNFTWARVLRMAWRSGIVGSWVLVVTLTVVAFLALGGRTAISNIRDELAGRSWLVTTLTALLAFFAIGPAILFVTLLASDEIARSGDAPPGVVRIENDLGRSTSITFCPKQECSGRPMRRLHDGDHVDFKVQDSDVPDSIVVQDRHGTTGCALLDIPEEDEENMPRRLSEEVTPGDCGADVDSMDRQ